MWFANLWHEKPLLHRKTGNLEFGNSMTCRGFYRSFWACELAYIGFFWNTYQGKTMDKHGKLKWPDQKTQPGLLILHLRVKISWKHVFYTVNIYIYIWIMRSDGFRKGGFHRFSMRSCYVKNLGFPLASGRWTRWRTVTFLNDWDDWTESSSIERNSELYTCIYSLDKTSEISRPPVLQWTMFVVLEKKEWFVPLFFGQLFVRGGDLIGAF